MLITQLITDILQKKLGDKYALFTNDAFDRGFTNSKQTPYGTVVNIESQAFNKYNNSILAVVSTTPNTLTNTRYTFAQLNYTVSFWVPCDSGLIDNYGRPMSEHPKFDYPGDMDKLIASLNGKQTEGNLSAYFTISEPQLLSATKERTGAYDRVVYQIHGQCSVSDSRLSRGEDLQIAIEVNGEWATFTDIEDFNILTSSDTAAIQEQSSISQRQEIIGGSTQVTFSLADFNAAEDIALAEVQRRAFNAVSPLGCNVRISKGNNILRTSYAIISVQYSVSGNASFGRYQVSLLLCEG